MSLALYAGEILLGFLAGAALVLVLVIRPAAKYARIWQEYAA